MNKLYKYLPFDIQVQYKDKDFNLIGCFNPNQVWLASTTSDKIWDRITANDTDVKPILRPFEDLTKELPLTKAAAEMIDMKEGEVIICLYAMLALNSGNTSHRTHHYSLLKNYEDLVLKTPKLEFCLLENRYIIDNWIRDVGINRTNTYFANYFDFKTLRVGYVKKQDRYANSFINKTDFQELYLDFLRAMKFNLDFEEDEYIKLKD